MPDVSDTVQPPSPWLLAIEGRAVCELASMYLTYPWVGRGIVGDGHPVLVLPGFMASDLSTLPLRKFLDRRGLSAHPWKLGRNLGLRHGLEGRLARRVLNLWHNSGRKVSLVGWSLGGVYARWMANLHPEAVRSVITLGSPFNEDPKANRSWRLFEWLSDYGIDEIAPETLERVQTTPPVPTTSIYSHGDGVAAWRCCIDREGPESENVRVVGSHIGLGVNPLVLHVIADRLAQTEGDWQPFNPEGLMQFLYPEPSAVGA